MDQPDIAPLARRLAEENNVDWRRLRGSGDDGRVVERDVLEYLARVMAGDEALDPTPEPVPEGMQAWPDADVRAGEAEAARDEVEGTSTIEDDIFLFDDAPAGDQDLDVDGHDDAAADGRGHDRYRSDAGADAVDAGQGERADPGSGDDLEEDLLVAGDDEPEPLDDAWSGEAGGVGGASASDPDLPDLFGAGPSRQPLGDAPPALFADESDGGDAPQAWSTGPELGDESADAPVWARDAGMGAVPSIDETTAADDVHADRVIGDLGRADAEDEDDDDAGVPPDLDVALDEPHLRIDDRDDVEADADDDVADDAADGQVAPPVAVPSTQTGQAAIGGDVPLLRHGHVWRRQVDLTALVCAQADLAADLGRDEPVPIGAFLLRAGQKALAARGGAVGLASIDAGDVRRARVGVTGDFASTVAALEAALTGDDPEGSGPVDLVVADLSELGIDDAVLQLDAPVLTLGRMLIDNQSGGRRAYLTMSGEGADGADAAQLLARVAELLESPVRIVL